MSQLRNLISRDLAMAKIAKEPFERRTLSFYRYVRIEDPTTLRDRLWKEWNELGILGRIYVAREGINAQMNVPEPHWERFVEQLNSYVEFEGMPFKIAVEEPAESFWKLTIKVRAQIVADGLPEDSYDVSDVGKHLSPEEFHTALEDENAIVVDMRNHYESRVGRFEKALCPDADTFREELPMVRDLLKGKEDKKVLLYCTGGIRCEKASSYLKHAGFRDVNQLYGGIINYAHEIKQKGLPSKFIGKNFVFDERGAETITDDVLSECDRCDVPCNEYVNCANKICNLLFLECMSCREQMLQTCSETCRQVVMMSEDEQRKLRAGIPHTFKRYKKQMRPKEWAPDPA
jgi:UPF0176 protein